MLRLGEALRGISARSVQFVTVPWTTYTGNAQWVLVVADARHRQLNWVQWVQPQANNLFSAIVHDDQAAEAPKQTKSSPSARRMSRCGYSTGRTQSGSAPRPPRA